MVKNNEAKIEYNIKVTVDIPNNNIDKQKTILDLEKYMKKNLERRLEFFYSEIQDGNKLRIKNSPIKSWYKL